MRCAARKDGVCALQAADGLACGSGQRRSAPDAIAQSSRISRPAYAAQSAPRQSKVRPSRLSHGKGSMLPKARPAGFWRRSHGRGRRKPNRSETSSRRGSARSTSRRWRPSHWCERSGSRRRWQMAKARSECSAGQTGRQAHPPDIAPTRALKRGSLRRGYFPKVERLGSGAMRAAVIFKVRQISCARRIVFRDKPRHVDVRNPRRVETCR